VKNLKYLVPNAMTSLSLLFAMLSMMYSLRGEIVMAGWFCLYCVLTDKLDGFAARALRATSPFGVQLDSFADFASFGLAPAVLFNAFLAANPIYGLHEGLGLLSLRVATGIYIIAVAVRLAWFNVVTTPDSRIFFGVPTTVVGGTLTSLFVALLKYGDPAATHMEGFSDPRLFGSAVASVGAMKLFPLYMLIGAYLMHAPLKVPKLGLTKNQFANVLIILNILGVYGFGAARWLPEYLAIVGTTYVVMSFIFGFVSDAARNAVRPSILAGIHNEPAPHEDDL
jgi:CDP-diacylglycerol--serine O-phosphatidyltransferase